MARLIGYEFTSFRGNPKLLHCATSSIAAFKLFSLNHNYSYERVKTTYEKVDTLTNIYHYDGDGYRWSSPPR